MPELVIISDREPSFEEWFEVVDETMNGRVVDLIGGGWHAVDVDDDPVVTWWLSQVVENPRTANQAVDRHVDAGQIWTDVLVPLNSQRGLAIAHRLAERIGGTVVRRT